MKKVGMLRWPGPCEACDLDKIINTLTKSVSPLMKQTYLKQEKANALSGMVPKLLVTLSMMSVLYIDPIFNTLFTGYT
jgi:hypothetical protein